MTKQFSCIISGRVQGVMYRDFARRTARRLGIGGTVQNLTDGTVQVVAEGDETKLNEFLLKLKQGPTFARVDGVVVNWQEATGAFENFDIVYCGFLDHF